MNTRARKLLRRWIVLPAAALTAAPAFVLPACRMAPFPAPRAAEVREPAGAASPLDLPALVRRVSPSVATVSVLHHEGREVISESLTTGSGVVIHEDGLILTCDHVVEGAESISVQLPGRESVRAEIVGRDPLGDLAMLQADFGEPVPALPLGDSTKLQVGDEVLAFGNPFNISRRDAQPSVSRGIVSALGRTTFPQNGRRRYVDAIQTDAAINPGNSGGPLVDLGGNVVGITGVISSRTGSGTGVGFAIPAQRVARALPALVAGKVVEHGWLGVVPADLPTREKGNGEDAGVVIVEALVGQPASLAGMRTNDLVTAINGERIRNTGDFINTVAAFEPGQTVRLTVLRGSDRLNIDIEVGRFPDD